MNKRNDEIDETEIDETEADTDADDTGADDGDDMFSQGGEEGESDASDETDESDDSGDADGSDEESGDDAAEGDDSEQDEAEEGDADESSAEGKYEINGQYFKTQREAFAYANKLAQEKDQVDAFNQGLLAAQKGGAPAESVTTKEPTKEELEEEIYKDLPGYVKKVEDKAVQKALQVIENKNRLAALWEEFYTENPDLRKKDKLVKTILTENWESLGKMPDHKQAMRILAKKTREEVRSWEDEKLPKKPLAPAGTRGASPSGTKTVTKKKAEDRPVDFASQINKMKEKRYNSGAR